MPYANQIRKSRQMRSLAKKCRFCYQKLRNIEKILR